MYVMSLVVSKASALHTYKQMFFSDQNAPILNHVQFCQAISSLFGNIHIKNCKNC